MNSAKYVFSITYISTYKSNVMLACYIIDVSIYLEISISCWHLGACLTNHMLLESTYIILKILNSNKT